MHHSAEPMEPASADNADPAVVDVSGMTMLQLLESGDPDLVAAVQHLLDHRPHAFVSRWGSFLDGSRQSGSAAPDAP